MSTTVEGSASMIRGGMYVSRSCNTSNVRKTVLHSPTYIVVAGDTFVVKLIGYCGMLVDTFSAVSTFLLGTSVGILTSLALYFSNTFIRHFTMFC